MKNQRSSISISSIYQDLLYVKKRRWQVIVTLVLLLMGLSVLQDLIYSRLKSTGFYLSESVLYQSFWVWFIPLLFLLRKLLSPWKAQQSVIAKITIFLIGLVFAVVHLLVFAAFFVLVSTLVYVVPHRFGAIFATAMANQLYLAILIYSVLPLGWMYIKNRGISTAETSTDKAFLQVKKAGKSIRIPIENILYFTADRPYVAVHTTSGKFLLHKSLKYFEDYFERSSFIRVHRGVILNTNAITEFTSRKNGDYDVRLVDGETLRLSRHYRANWQELLQ